MKFRNLRNYVLGFMLIAIAGWITGTIIAMLLWVPVLLWGPATKIYVSESNADHGDTLEEVMKGIRNEKYEYVAVFCNTNKILEVTNHDECSVTYTAGWPESMASSMVMVHNHPAARSQSQSHCSFSYRDLSGLCRSRLFQKSIIVSGNTMYILSAPDGWPDLEEVRKFFCVNYGMWCGEDDKTTISDLQRDALVQQGYLLEFDDGTGFSSLIVSEFAEYFGLNYIVASLPCEDDVILEVDLNEIS